jgi:ankyrin repeat protein
MGVYRSKEILVLKLVQYSDYLLLEDLCKIYNLSNNIPLSLVYFKNKNYMFDFIDLKENIMIKLFQDIVKKYPPTNLNILNKDKKTSLFIASRKNYSKYIKLLLTFPEIDVNFAEEKRGFTPLWIACRYNNVDSLKILLNHPEIDINKANNYDITPLHIASSIGNIECLKLLINIKNIDVNKADRDGITALGAASWCGHTECVKLLLIHPDIDINIKDNNNMTPFMCAQKNDRKEIIKILSKIA